MISTQSLGGSVALRFDIHRPVFKITAAEMWEAEDGRYRNFAVLLGFDRVLKAATQGPFLAG